jgi:hypothetical protein
MEERDGCINTGVRAMLEVIAENDLFKKPLPKPFFLNIGT